MSPSGGGLRVGLFDLFKKKKNVAVQEEKPDLSIYTGMRVEVTTLEGDLLFVAKLKNLREDTAELEQYSETEISIQETESIRVKIRGYHDREKKAIYLEGTISPLPFHYWKVEELEVSRIANDRGFFRLGINVEATATTFGGVGAGEKPCRLLNISVGGVCIASENLYQEGDKFLLKVKLLEDREMSAMYCQVLRVIDKGEAKYEYGCRFLELNDSDEEKITQNIFAIQRRQRGVY
ncbi:MAG: PilZ domain-containing protein [Oscillibacter sp.]|nr:PilZ domain-containing protein [Oscillibacter sp.]